MAARISNAKAAFDRRAKLLDTQAIYDSVRNLLIRLACGVCA